MSVETKAPKPGHPVRNDEYRVVQAFITEFLYQGWGYSIEYGIGGGSGDCELEWYNRGGEKRLDR